MLLDLGEGVELKYTFEGGGSHPESSCTKLYKVSHVRGLVRTLTNIGLVILARISDLYNTKNISNMT